MKKKCGLLYDIQKIRFVCVTFMCVISLSWGSWSTFCLANDVSTLPILFRGDVSPANAAYTINRPGVYRLTSAKTASGVPNISITANNVTLDLGGNTLSGGTNGIEITGDNVIVKNGAVTGMTGNGVFIQGDGCRLGGLDVSVCVTGITLQSCNQCNVENCSLQNMTRAGVSLQSTWTSVIDGCSVTGVQSSADAYGFIAANGGNNIFDGCTVSDVRTTYTSALADVPGWVTAVSGGFLLKGELGSQVLDCQGNSITAPAGYKNQAYGLGVLSGGPLTTADMLSSVTQSPYAEGLVRSVAWLVSGGTKYLASGGIGTNEIKIYRFDEATSSLFSVTQNSYADGVVYSVAWLVSGGTKYLASGGAGTNEIKIYRFDEATSSLFSVTQNSYADGTVNSVAWLVSGGTKYLALGGTGTNEIKIYKFEEATSSLYSVTQSSYAEGSVNSVAWLVSGDTKYLASGGYPSGDTGNQVKIYRFDEATSSLYSVTHSSYAEALIHSVAWLVAGDTKYLASGGYPSGDTGNQVKIYRFDEAISSLYSVTESSYAEGLVYSVAWLVSGDTKYLASGGYPEFDTGNQVKIYRFDEATSSLFSVTQNSYAEDSVLSVAWLTSNGVNYLASGGNPGGNTGNQVKLYTLSGEQQRESENCLLTNNNVSRVSSSYRSLAVVGEMANGTGLSISTTFNYVAKNSAYDCDISFAGVSPEYITSQANMRGVYNIDSALTTPDQVEVAGDSVTASAGIVDDMYNNMSSITSMVNNRFDCSYTPILTATTVTTPGTYCLARTINGGNLLVTGTGITLALNNRTISNGKLVISGDRVNVSNGLIRGTTSGSTISGVSLTGNNCQLSDIRTVNCRTGFELTGATKNTLDNCQALNSSREGFLLTNAQYNTLSDCQVTSVVGTGTLAGIKTTGGVGNEIVDCSVNQVNSTASGDAYGIWGVTESRSQINNNSINDITAPAGFATGLQIDQNMWMSNVLSFTWAFYYKVSQTLVHHPSWVNVREGLSYLATVGDTDNIMRIFRYDGSSTFNFCYEMTGPGSGGPIRWLQAYGNIYLAAVWNNLDPNVYVYKFDPESETLFLQATLLFDTTIGYFVRGIDWLKLSDGQILLGMTGAGFTSQGAIKVASFDGENLTLVSQLAYGSTTLNECEWLVTGTKIYMATLYNATADTLRIFEYTPNLNTISLRAYEGPSGATGTGNGVKWMVYNNKIYIALTLDTDASAQELQIFTFNPANTVATTALTALPNAKVQVNSYIRGPDWLVTGTSMYVAFGTYVTSSEINVYKFDPDAGTLTSYYSIALPDAYACYGVSWFGGAQGRALLTGGFACTTTSPNYLAVKVFGFDIVNSTSSIVQYNQVCNVVGADIFSTGNIGAGIKVNPLSDGVLSNKVCNASNPYPSYPGWYDPSNQIISG